VQARVTPAYCPTCLDVWFIEAGRIARRDFINIPPGVRMHVACGRALAAIEAQRSDDEWRAA
jgi:hypothetical protein